MKKLWGVYTVEYYRSLKKNEIMNTAGKWMELDKVILNDVTQTQKEKCCMFSLSFGDHYQFSYLNENDPHRLMERHC